MRLILVPVMLAALLFDRARAGPAELSQETSLSSPGEATKWAASAISSAERLKTGTRKPLERFSVFVDAAPLQPRYPRLQASDVVTLTTALASLLEQVPARAVRLVVFNLDTETAVRSDSFGLAQMGEAKDALNKIRLGTIDYRQLKQQQGVLPFLASLIDHELHEQSPADAVIFLGPLARVHGRFPSVRFDAPRPLPRFYYLQYRSGSDPSGKPTPPAEIQDVISNVVEHLHGHTFVLLKARDFAHAVERISPSAHQAR